MPRLVALWWPVLTTVAQPQDPSLVGWRMVDRFAGFRYEVKGPHVVQSGFHTAAEKLADELGCFGWIQDSEFRTVVGEARCAKTVADKFKAFLREGHPTSEVEAVDIYDYPDTKIKLHFSHFKRLGSDRVTWFVGRRPRRLRLEAHRSAKVASMAYRWAGTRTTPSPRAVLTRFVPRSFPSPPHACRDDHLRRWPEGQEYPDGCDEDGCEPIVGSGEEL